MINNIWHLRQVIIPAACLAFSINTAFAANDDEPRVYMPLHGGKSCQSFLRSNSSGTYVDVLQGSLIATYQRTNRGRKRLVDEGLFTKEILDPATMVGKRVLDIGTGDGQLVKDLFADGVDVIGTDIFLTKEEKGFPNLFIEADARSIPLPSSSIDIGLSAQSVFSKEYQSSFTDEFLVETMTELHRLLSPGGVHYIANGDVERLTRICKKVPGLELRVGPTLKWGVVLIIIKTN